jgi:hypothetical protein
MLILHDPDEFETVWVYHTCAYHRAYPHGNHAGCTCSSSCSQKRRPPDEVTAIKAKRLREEEDRILAQAEIIKAKRALEALDMRKQQETRI